VAALGIDAVLVLMIGEPGTPPTELTKPGPPWKFYSPTGPVEGRGVGEL